MTIFVLTWNPISEVIRASHSLEDLPAFALAREGAKAAVWREHNSRHLPSWSWSGYEIQQTEVAKGG